MDPFLTEELHHIPFEINELEVESNLLSASPNGLVFVARRNDLAIFSASDYHQASSSFSQRKDKPLTTFQPSLCIDLPRCVTWLSVNCSGSLLLIAYGSSIQLLNIQQLSTHSPHGLLGNALDIPNDEGTIREIAWNPADKHRFALITTTGSVRMFVVNPLQEPHISSSGCLPASIQAKCLSWSPKGKQLAFAGIGTLSESTANPAATNSASIVQVDHDLKVKRIIPIDALLKQHLKDLTEPRPIDILWTSSYCFLLSVVDANSAKEMRLVFITVPPKSEARLEKLPEFTSFSNGLCHYLMCLVPNSTTLAAVTWSSDAEECYLLDIPSITSLPKSPSADSLPKLIKSLPLPTDSNPIAMHVGALVDSPDPLPLIIGLLANGALFAFKLLPPNSTSAGGSCNIFAGFRMWCGSAEKPPQLPSVAARLTTSEPPSPAATSRFGNTPKTTDGTAAPSGFTGLFGKSKLTDGSVASVTSAVATKSEATTTTSVTLSPAPTLGSLFGKPAATASTTSTIATTSSVVPFFGKPASASTALSGFATAASLKTPPGKSATTDGPSTNLTVTTAATSDVKLTSAGENSSAEPSPLTQSIMEASNHFWKALKSQAETSARAWSHLQSVFEGNSLNLQRKGDENGVRRGVWDIEQSLNNMDDFLRVVEEITSELRKASQLSVSEQTASADFLDRLCADFEAFRHRINDKHRVIVAAGLDPKAAATLASLRRKSRAAESFLAELEDQVESLSAQLEARNECTHRLVGRSGSKSNLPVGDVGSPFDKIRATIATNARFIKSERYRLELISRMAGVSLSDCSADNSKNTSTLAPSLGGSAVSVDREQRDARLYRLLCARDKCKTKTREEKSSVAERLPIAKAPSTVAEVLKLMRKEKEKEEAQPIKLTPKSAGRTQLKAAGASSSSKTASQMSLPGQQKNLEISKLLASAASVPPVTLASGYLDSKAGGFTFSIVTEDVRTSTPLQKVTEKPQFPKVPITKSEAPAVTPSSVGDVVPAASPQKPPPSGVTSLSKPPIFVPSTSKSLTLPTRATPIAAPTTKVFGAPMGDSGVENFKPLSPRLPSPTNASDGTSTVSVSRKSPTFASTSVSTTAQASSSPLGSISAPITTTSEPTSALSVISTPPNAEAVKAESPPAVTSIVSKPSTGGLFGPSSLPTPTTQQLSNEKSVALASPTLTAANTAASKPNPFGLPSVASTATATATTTTTPVVTSVSMSPEPSRCLFGLKSSLGKDESTVSVPSQSNTATVGNTPTTAIVTQPSQLPGSAVVTSAAPSQSNQIFGNVAATTTTTAATVSQLGQILGTTVSTAATAASNEPGLIFGTAVATTAVTTQPSKLFGTGVTTVSTSQPSLVFGTAATTTTPATLSTQFFGSAVATITDSKPGRGFGQSPSTTAATQPVAGLFGQPSATTSSQSGSLFGGLFGQSITKTDQAKGGLFGQSTSPASTQAGGLFGQSSTPPSVQAGGLFGQSPAPAVAQTGALFAQSGQTGGLFGSSPSTTTSQATSLFGQSPVVTSSQPGGLFGQPIGPKSGTVFGQSPPPSGGFFGQPAVGTAAPTGGLFGQVAPGSAPSTGGLFGTAAANTTAASSGLFGQLSTTPTRQAGGLFGNTSTNGGGGASNLFASSKLAEGSTGTLFGTSTITSTTSTANASPSLQHVSNVSNLFAMSNFGLGSTSKSGSTTTTTINVFGKPSTVEAPSALNTANVPARNLFGSSTPTSSSTNFTGVVKPGSLFAPSTLNSGGGGLFSNQTIAAAVPATTTTTAGGGGGLFSGSGGLFGTSSATAGGPLFGGPAFGSSGGTPGGLFSSSNSGGGGGLFGGVSSVSTPTPGGFGAAPSFGAPAVFGGSPFGGMVGAGNPSTAAASGFGTSSGAGGLFASLGSSSGGVSFGGLANSATQPPTTPMFGTSPSFTQRRAWAVLHALIAHLFFLLSQSETTSPNKSKRLKKELEREDGEEIDTPPDFYIKSAKYWSGVDATVNGMLGGLSRVHRPDIAGSKSVLARFGPSRRERALDCGAGIGRVTKHLLLPHFLTVDMVEMTEKFLDASVAYIGQPDADRVGKRFCCTLQDFTPPQGQYDVIWVQWVIGHLTLPATVEFLHRCAAGLRPCDSATANTTDTTPVRRSVIVLKDNVYSDRGKCRRQFEDGDDSKASKTHPPLRHTILVVMR
ncbi:hypothetical protein TcWFU_005628 [Taenia crassiceps]|uniref:Alpha N-terminal protein methyltransferase 1 n=1 Tax=Taenia crassiceps TaxID=6207 RepID=A0ABR4Q230_9CEST